MQSSRQAHTSPHISTRRKLNKLAMAALPADLVPSDGELLQAQADLWRICLSYLKPQALTCAVKLGIPTAISRLGGAAPLPELVAALSLPTVKQPCLARLMRLLAASGVFAVDDITGVPVYRLNALSYLLVDGVLTDGNASQKAVVLTTSSKYHLEAAMGLADWFRKDAPSSPFEDAHGATLFEESMAELDPEADKVFHEALAAHDQLGVAAGLREFRDMFMGFTSLTDCCGGDGTTARAIATAFPHIKCTVLDLPKVIEKIPRDGVVNYVAGDMFSYIPPAQVVVLKLVLHFWTDEDCVKILTQCKKAIPTREEGGKVIVGDIVLGSSSSDPMVETHLLMDMLMMVYTRGRQRDEKDFSELFEKAGFSDYKIIKNLGARSIFEVYP